MSTLPPERIFAATGTCSRCYKHVSTLSPTTAIVSPTHVHTYQHVVSTRPPARGVHTATMCSHCLSVHTLQHVVSTLTSTWCPHCHNVSTFTSTCPYCHHVSPHPPARVHTATSTRHAACYSPRTRRATCVMAVNRRIRQVPRKRLFYSF